MKKRRFIAITTVTLGLFLTACQKTPGPEIDLLELGYENSKTAHTGDELHIEAEIVAEGTIETVKIVIHPEGEHKKSAFTDNEEGEWEVDTTYTEFSGLKNTIFHEHIDVDEHAEPGHYHFHLTVTDMDGRQASGEDEIEILQAEGSK